MAITYATKETYDGLVSSGVVLVDFYADTCAPCRMLAPVLEKMAEQRPDIKIVKVDAAANGQLASEHGVRGIPTLKVYKDGKEVSVTAGFKPLEALISYVDNA